MNFGEGLGRSGRKVHREDANIENRRLYVHDPQAGGSSTPAVAENWLVVAVEVGKVRRIGVGREEGCGLVERSLNLAAVAETGLVASSDQHPPLLGVRVCRLDAV